MLRYLGFGFRQFGLFPLVSKPRLNWEFYAVVQGRCAPVFGPGAKSPFSTKTFWVFPPGSSHGWAGEGKRRCYVTAFHFGSVPPELDAVVRAGGCLKFSLTSAECKRFVALARALQPDFKRRTNLSNLLFQGALAELALVALRKLPKQTVVLPENHAEQTVEAATRWFLERAHLNPSIAAVAREMHVSVSTLRRRFYVTRQASPAHVFEKIRIGLAMQLMSGTSNKLDFIATQCGYSCTSDFCRAFKSFTKITPNVWRRTIIGPPPAAFRLGRREAPGPAVPGTLPQLSPIPRWTAGGLTGFVTRDGSFQPPNPLRRQA